MILSKQLQVEPITRGGGGLYHGVLQSTHTIIRGEGVSALWKGHVTAQALSVSFGLIQVSLSFFLIKLVVTFFSYIN